MISWRTLDNEIANTMSKKSSAGVASCVAWCRSVRDHAGRRGNHPPAFSAHNSPFTALNAVTSWRLATGRKHTIFIVSIYIGLCRGHTAAGRCTAFQALLGSGPAPDMQQLPNGTAHARALDETRCSILADSSHREASQSKNTCCFVEGPRNVKRRSSVTPSSRVCSFLAQPTLSSARRGAHLLRAHLLLLRFLTTCRS